MERGYYLCLPVGDMMPYLANTFYSNNTKYYMALMSLKMSLVALHLRDLAIRSRDPANLTWDLLRSLTPPAGLQCLVITVK